MTIKGSDTNNSVKRMYTWMLYEQSNSELPNNRCSGTIKINAKKLSML